MLTNLGCGKQVVLAEIGGDDAEYFRWCSKGDVERIYERPRVGEYATDISLVRSSLNIE
jgi:hypothetical protein